MPLPDHVETDDALEAALTQPNARDLEWMAALSGDLLVVGAGGKMGPSLAIRAHRAAQATGTRCRVYAASRFSSASARAALETSGVKPIACDLLDERQIAALPACDHVLYLAGRKFGTADRSDLTWTVNTVAAARVAERFSSSRIVVFSTGNVYPLVPAPSTSSIESDLPGPVGEYAQSCLGRERVVEYVSRERGTPVLMFRLNYAVDLRYGTLVDIARRVFEGQPVDLTVGWSNAIWQGDANSYALRSLDLCESPPSILNVTGPDRIPVRATAEWFAQAFRVDARFENAEGPLALLSDSTKCRTALGEPDVSLSQLRSWVAHWVSSGGASLGKPTHFEVADGRF
jgi:hypothetical protein